MVKKKKSVGNVGKEGMDWLKILALILIIAGIILIISSGIGITGNVISVSDSEVVNNIGFWIGVVLIVVGGLLGAYKVSRPGHDGEFHGRNSLRRSNSLARTAARWNYIEEHNGREPTNEQLRDYLRELHENKEISDVVASYESRQD